MSSGYSFPKDLESVRTFYNKVVIEYPNNERGLFLKHNLDENERSVARAKEVIEINEKMSRKLIPVMLCMIWENFVASIKLIDPVRHGKHFYGNKKIWPDPISREISLIRNCIIHKNSVIGEQYEKHIKETGLTRFGYRKGDEVDISDPDIEEFFKHFEYIFNLVTT